MFSLAFLPRDYHTASVINKKDVHERKVSIQRLVVKGGIEKWSGRKDRRVQQSYEQTRELFLFHFIE